MLRWLASIRHHAASILIYERHRGDHRIAWPVQLPHPRQTDPPAQDRRTEPRTHAPAGTELGVRGLGGHQQQAENRGDDAGTHRLGGRRWSGHSSRGDEPCRQPAPDPSKAVQSPIKPVSSRIRGVRQTSARADGPALLKIECFDPQPRSALLQTGIAWPKIDEAAASIGAGGLPSDRIGLPITAPSVKVRRPRPTPCPGIA